MRIDHRRDPDRFAVAVLEILRAHGIAARVDVSAFRLAEPHGVVRGEIRPVVRRPWSSVAGSNVVALGEAAISLSPLALQQPTFDRHCAWALGEAILAEPAFDAVFCRWTARRLWEAAESAAGLADLLLHPASHFLVLVAAARRHQGVADALAAGLGDPAAGWRMAATPQRVAATLHRLGAPASTGIPSPSGDVELVTVAPLEA